jgi:membrane protease YdiL (CAAX protease family)
VLSLAAILYGLFAGGAALWCWLAGRLPWPLYDPAVSTWPRLLTGICCGLTFGLLVVLGSRVMVGRLRWARALYRWFREALGPLTARQVLALALLSSIGEELFFRGAMQPAWGVVAATLVFGLLHFPSRLALWPWTVMAGALGLVFGYLTLWTGSVAGATVAHFVVNLLNLRQITRSHTDWDEAAEPPSEKLPDPQAMGRMDDHEADPSDSRVRSARVDPERPGGGAQPQ